MKKSLLASLGRVLNRVEMPNGTDNFWKFQISGKRDNLARLTKISEMDFSKITVPFDFEPEIWSKGRAKSVLPFFSFLSTFL